MPLAQHSLFYRPKRSCREAKFISFGWCCILAQALVNTNILYWSASSHQECFPESTAEATFYETKDIVPLIPVIPKCNSTNEMKSSLVKWPDLPVEIVEEGKEVEGQLTPGLFLAVTQGVCVHDCRWIIGQLWAVCWATKIPERAGEDNWDDSAVIGIKCVQIHTWLPSSMT